MRILITRQQPHANLLAEKITALGWAKALICPLLEIIPTTHEINAAQVLDALTKCDLAIFTSQNAVTSAMPLLQNFSTTSIAIAAIGSTTALELQKYTDQNIIMPTAKPFNSAALLARLTTFHYKQRAVMIFTGEQGHDLLANSLRVQGINVTCVPCYRRAIPTTSADNLASIIKHGPIDIILITCETSLIALTNIVQTTIPSLLTNSRLIVASNRIMDTALCLKWEKVYLANGASDNDMLKTITLTQRINMKQHAAESTSHNLLNLSKQGKVVIGGILIAIIIILIAVCYAIATTYMLRTKVTMLEQKLAHAQLNHQQLQATANLEQTIETTLNTHFKPQLEELRNHASMLQSTQQQQLPTAFTPTYIHISTAEKLNSATQQIINNFDTNLAARLIYLAEYNLTVMHDKAACIRWLQFCSQWLTSLNQQHFSKLIHAIAQDIAAINRPELPAQVVHNYGTITQKSFWLNLPQQLWQAIKSNIKIRNNNTLESPEFTNYAETIAKPSLKLTSVAEINSMLNAIKPI